MNKMPRGLSVESRQFFVVSPKIDHYPPLSLITLRNEVKRALSTRGTQLSMTRAAVGRIAILHPSLVISRSRLSFIIPVSPETRRY